MHNRLAIERVNTIKVGQVSKESGMCVQKVELCEKSVIIEKCAKSGIIEKYSKGIVSLHTAICRTDFARYNKLS
jgi:hypothetical protein